MVEVLLQYSHTADTAAGYEHLCMYFDPSSGQWDTPSCQMQYSGPLAIQCTCSRLGDGAVAAFKRIIVDEITPEQK